MELRPYQREIVNKIDKVLQTYKSPVVVLPCGGGKSVICADIAKQATRSGKEVLFLVHRIELVDQIRDTFQRYGVDSEHCDIKMVQSSKYLDKYYDLILTDESHHSTCRTYQNIYKKFPMAKRVNVTATPCRTDGRGLGETCDYLLETVDTKWLIENKFLSPYEYYSPKILADFSSLKKIAGEYENQTELFDKPKIYGDIFKYYKPGKKAICYCASIEHSLKVAAEFNQRGIPARHLDGGIGKEERRQIIEDFRTGKIMVLCNYSLIAEGFDVPDCDMVMLLRKTASLNLFIQMTMRCMRYKEGKTAIILDFCGNVYEHGLPDEKRKWSLDTKKKLRTNSSSEPDVVARTCKFCFKTYSGTNRICPYCHEDNGKTKKQIEQDEKEELERILVLEKLTKRQEQSKARTFEELIKLGKDRGYKNPSYWAMQILRGRERRR